MAALRGAAPAPDVEELEIALLLEALLQRYGYDFRAFERAAVRRKLRGALRQRGLASISALQEQVLHQPQAGAALLRALGVAPAAPFDDPAEARQLRAVLGACLPASAAPKVWLAECAGAGQAWTLAILLQEERLQARTEIFATVASEQALAEAADAGFPAARLDEYAAHYRRSGGSARFADYFELGGGRAVLRPALRSRITWAQYNLVTDASCNEFQLIVCRRALPDYGPLLRRRVLQLFHDSLARFGVLGIDAPLRADDALAHCYQALDAQQPWYKRIA
ncbi:CheR family methyltransferase [Janthinobacterium fluminis]|uniref:Chemotaxis protein n=1 Tax=Janthinobacterium fluminis TaxID=2987524 RepID=A0ABT5JXX6_9BURK|nr:CheR family methyltransferase [Janthinobacterium fluminis]MDC8756402.1 chemotaxis protein [Janthinobacterium fluminis]